MTDGISGQWRRLVDVFEHDRRSLTRFVQSKLHGDAGGNAEDIVSDVFLRLLERADLLSRIEDLQAYVYTALSNGIVDLFRRRRSLESFDSGTPERDDDTEEIATPDPNPEQSLAQRERLARLLDALEEISPAERAVWAATEIEGSSFQYLSRKWQEPIGTLLSRKSRATKKLRLLLGEFVEK